MIYANLSSTIGNAKNLETTLESIYYQVDEINIFTTGYKNPVIKDNKINIHVSAEFNPNDNGRFFFVDKVDGFYFTMDDSIIYPPSYVKNTLPRLATYDVVCYGGKSFRSFPIKSYETSSIDKYHYSAEVSKDRCVQFPNTGVTAFHVNDFKFSYKDFNRIDMADVLIGCLAKKKGKLITCLKKERNWIVPNANITIGEIDEEKTIYVNENFVKK